MADTALPIPAPRATRAASPRRARGLWPFSALTSRIVTLNVIGLVALLAGILYLNQYRESLIEARIEALMIQAEIIGGAIAYTAGNPDDPLGLDPQEARDAMLSLVPLTQTRAQLWLNDRAPIADTGYYIGTGQVLTRPLPAREEGFKAVLGRIYDALTAWMPAGASRITIEPARGSPFDRRDARLALAGRSTSAVRQTQSGDLIVTVAVPVQRYRVIQGALLLATEAGDIDNLVRAERLATIEVFLVALAVTVSLSLLLAATIARPIRRLAEAARRVDPARARQALIPDLTARRDEIGDLSGSLGAMTRALLDRIGAIESFAADVAHEIKNPLTSLRSAVETLGRVKTDEQRARLLAVILDDVGRIDRLISDISAASRLDAELARADVGAVDLAALLETLDDVYANMTLTQGRRVTFAHDGGVQGRDGLIVVGLESRLGQVMRNLIDNALSFSPADGTVRVMARRRAGGVDLIVDDDGPGIPEDSLSRIFDRFYSERPEGETFGEHSGLGLSIARQIVEAHGGALRAENRRDADGRVAGARFTVSLPA